MPVGRPGDHLDVARVAEDEVVEEPEAERAEVDHPAGGRLDLVALLGRDPLGQAAGHARAGVDRPAADDLDDAVAAAAGLDDPAAGVAADLLQDAEEVALRDRRVGPDHEVGPREGIEVGRVVGHVEGRVEELPEELRGPWRIDLVDGVGRLGRGHVVGLGADAADAVHEGRHVLDRPADAELLEAAQLRDLEVGALHLAGVVEEDLDLAVALEAGDRVDGDAGHGALPQRAPARAGSGTPRRRGPARGRRAGGLRRDGWQLRLHDRAAAPEERAGEAEAVDLADRVRDPVEDPVDVIGLVRLDDRGEGGHQPGPVVDDAVGRAVAADALGAGGRAQGPAAVAGGRSVAGDPLLEQAQRRVEAGHLLDADELRDLLDVAGPGALVADGGDAGAHDAALRGQRPRPRQPREQGRDRLGDPRRLRRTTGHRVVDRDHLVEGPQEGQEDRDAQLALRGRPRGARHDAIGVDRRRAVAVGSGEDLGDRGEVGEAGDAALVGARAEGHEDLRLAAQEVGQLLVLAAADASREEADVDVAVRHGLDVPVLGVHDGRPEARSPPPPRRRGSSRGG